MNFRKMEVTGFKSFADKIELVFETGTTAIVGPNGCGKSNIADAIKWALGEQSAKALRCDKMEGLIFNGGANRRPLGLAEVALTMTNTGKTLPTEYNDVEVSRRLYRSGESEYSMNRKRCLLKDIQELFMDTGLGLSSYSIMEQGHIDMILNSSAQDRRLILEEAAGITKFRHRKRTSLRKLEATEQNLVRINDILYELERQVASLKRQASKARRYQTYHDELKELDTKLSLRKYYSLATDFKNTQDKLTSADDEMQSISASITKLEAELETHRLTMAQAQGKLADLRTQERKVQTEIEDAESEIAVLKERRDNLQQRQKRAITEVERVQKQLEDSEKQVAAAQIEKGKLGETIASQEKELKLAQERADKLTEAAKVAEKKLDTLKSQTINILNRKAKAQNELSTTESRLDYSITRLERLYSNADNFLTEQTQLKETLAKLRLEMKSKEDEISDLTIKQKQISTEIRELQSKVASADREIRSIEQKRGARSSRLQSLQELQKAYEGYNAGVKAILGKGKGKKSAEAPFEGVCGVIAEIIRTEPRYEAAIEASLGSSIQVVVTETVEDAKNAVEYLKDRKIGRATLISMDLMDQKHLNNSAPFPDDVIVAEQVVEFDDKYSSVVNYLLGKTLIVENLDRAVELAKGADPAFVFATLDGQIMSAAGIITGGTGAEGAGLLRRSREIGDLKKEVAELSGQLASMSEEREKIAAEVSSQQRDREKISGELQQKQISLASVQKDMSQCKQRLERVDRELSVVEKERDTLEADIVTLEEKKKKLAENSVDLERQSEEINRSIATLQAELRTKSQQRDAVISQCTNIQVQLAAKKQQQRGLVDKFNSLERERNRLRQTLSSHQTSATSDEESEKEIAEKIETRSKTLKELFEKRTKFENETAELETQRQKAQTDLAEGEAAIRDSRSDIDQLSQGKYQLEVAKTQLQMNIDSLTSKMQERYGVSIKELRNQGDSDLEETEELSEEELESRIEELRDRMAKMGTVNLTAVDEYNRQKERYDLLITQKEDLLKAKESLYGIIQRINRESRDRLKETFDSVNAGFQELFTRLFGGGQAELVMIGEGDVLESGVEMNARPPGKKPQTIAMLSSGERSLTAIALLFALFKSKPSPFCVMDEVDAALDDANVGRFADMVREFSKNTQFVVITHNKRTMEMADVLYGVTMEESGVSKLVSLRIGEGDSASEAAG